MNQIAARVTRRAEAAPKVRSATTAEIERFDATMTLAFSADSVARWAWPDPAQFLAVFRPLVMLFGGKACPTIIETSTRKKLAGEEVKIGDGCFKRGGVFAMELGGPEVGRGCGGRGIIHARSSSSSSGFSRKWVSM